MSNEIPKGYEPAENGYAKNIAMDALETELERQGHYPYDESDPIDLIDLSDFVVEALLKAGVTIPENIVNPHAIPNN